MESALCVICGERPPTTGQGDHVPPKSIYTKRERTAKWQFHTVPACSQCNNGGSADDEALKLLLGIETGEARGSEDVINLIAKTIGKNQRLANGVFSSAQSVSVNDGGAARQMVAVEFDGAAYERVVQRIARAMYWRMTKTIAGNAAKVSVLPPGHVDETLAQNLVDGFSTAPMTEVNGGTLQTRLLQFDGMALLAMRFFNKHEALAVFKFDASVRSTA